METVYALIVDDEEPFRRSLTRLFEREEMHCVAAHDAQQARAALKRQRFDFMLCDVNMPGESGLDLVTFVAGAYPDMAILMVTGVDDQALASVAIEAGVHGYVVKPFTHNELIINVNNALHRRRLEADARAHQRDLVRTVREQTEHVWASSRKVELADQRQQESIEEMMRRLSLAAELRDPETARHIERMSRYSGALCHAIQPGERTEQVRLASRLHDAGKIGVPDRILRKKGRFTPDEFEVMKEHAQAGSRLFEGSDAELLQLAGSIAWTHHERWDGSGYPRCLAGDEIPLEGRIAAIADVFDALMSKRPYKPAYPLPQVAEIMREQRGAHFDPDLLDVFFDNLDPVLAISQEFAD